MNTLSTRNCLFLLGSFVIGLITYNLPKVSAYGTNCHDNQIVCDNGADARYNTCISDCQGDPTCQGDCAGQRNSDKASCSSDFSSCIQGERVAYGGVGNGCSGAGKYPNVYV